MKSVKIGDFVGITSRKVKTEVIAPETVLKYTKPTEKFLCSLSQNKYIQFLEFGIRDEDTKKKLFQVVRPDIPINWDNLVVGCGDEIRTINYHFDKSLLDAKTVATTLAFAVGPTELKDFRMIERHYFKGKLLRSYDFTFGFCIPNSVNNWDSSYAVPKMDAKLKQDIINSPGESYSDSFYFVGDTLIMHNKATYSYM